MKVSELIKSEYNEYYKRYISRVSNNIELRKGFELDKMEVINFFSELPKEKLLYRYENNKWSIKEVLQHLIDTERIFMYRCFRIARYDQTPLAGFDQDEYISPSNADKKSLDDLLNEFKMTRDFSISLLNSLTDDDLKSMGNSNGFPMSARAAAFTILGHDLWHIQVIKERYL